MCITSSVIAQLLFYSVIRQSKHVVLKSPHIAHHVMSDAEARLYSEQRKDEGDAFKRLSQSPESVS